MASTASLSPWTNVEHAVGQPGLLEQFGHFHAGRGHFFRRLEDERVSAGDRHRNIHSGTIAGKLNGVMPAHTPTGWRSVWQSTPEPAFSVYSPFNRCGMPQANSITSMPRCTLPSASGSRLAVLLRGEPREFLLVRLHQREKLLHHARAAQRRRTAPAGERRACRLDREIDVLEVGKGHAFGHLARGRLVTSPGAQAGRRKPRLRSPTGARWATH